MSNNTTASQDAVLKARSFLQQLFPDIPPDLRLVVCTKGQHGGMQSHWCHSVDGAAQEAVAATERGLDAYMGVALQDPDAALREYRKRRDKPDASLAETRGCDLSAGAICGVVLDIDVAVGKHASEALPPTQAAALEALAELPFAPTLIVSSGGGLHVYYLWREPWLLETAEEQQRAQRLSRAWHGLVKDLFQLKGWNLDSVHDLSRLLRVVATVNSKYGTEVTLLQEDGPRYNPSDFEDLLGLVGEPQAEESASPRPSADITLTDEDKALLDRILSSKQAAKFETLFKQGDWRSLGYKSQSEADLAMVGILSYWSGQDAARIDRIFRASALYRPKWDQRRGDSSYGERTMRQCVSRAGASRKEEAPTLAAPQSTDVGNARRFIDRFGDDLLNCKSLKQWYCWNGQRWIEDATGKVTEMAKQLVQEMLVEASKVPSEAERTALCKHALASQAEPRIRRMIALAESDPQVAIVPEDLDRDPWLLNVENGTLDLRLGMLRPHSRGDLLTKLASAPYEAEAKSDLWESFLNDVTGGDAEPQGFLQRCAGMSLSGDVSEERILLIEGPGRTGKSAFMEALRSAMGSYAVSSDFESFLDRKFASSARSDIAAMKDARMVVAAEVAEGRSIDQALVKHLTGGEPVTARPLYKGQITFLPQLTLWFVANHAPRVPAEDDAIWRRLIRIPLPHVVPEERVNLTLKSRFRDDHPTRTAVLAWMVRGCLDWQQLGLQVPQSIADSTANLRREMDPVLKFSKEWCELIPGFLTPAAQLRESFDRWSRARGEMPVNDRQWGTAWKRLGVESTTRRSGDRVTRCWKGVRLMS